MQPILKHIFDRDTLQEIPVESLQQMTLEYPFFAMGHFLLAKKLKDLNDQAFEEKFQKTALYFHNPLLLVARLKQGNTFPEHTVAAQPETNTAPEAIPTDSDFSSHDLIEDVILHQETAYGTPEETISEQITNPEKETFGGSQTFEEAPAFKLNGAAPDDDKQKAGSELNQSSAPNPVAGNETPQQRDLTSPDNGQGPKEKLVFQAYHTVDYFASQGIRLSQEIQPDDKLGKQLKSFTEWLKTMRRLPEVAIEEVLDKPENYQIEQFAAHSLEEKEVVAEAMAEVLLKQGKSDKASEIYHKLSLLNPRKSAYFAARIEELKQH